ncbi:hypothetical protein BOTBODRAFT_142987 [Botryobasidium botryosum FD-172 SS1]|uniref:Uncharacterized protein n=1 Tax=Botryobasidium botryosum (strain FD-172 SS1) TaxID=930990 RepID=A0A067N6Q7_BOTB1|nr:hypothetical protein BOTBODRAFT_142987 [Botryobasidium botryosum FD-172 SS1]
MVALLPRLSALLMAVTIVTTDAGVRAAALPRREKSDTALTQPHYQRLSTQHAQWADMRQRADNNGHDDDDVDEGKCDNDDGDDDDDGHHSSRRSLKARNALDPVDGLVGPLLSIIAPLLGITKTLPGAGPVLGGAISILAPIIKSLAGPEVGKLLLARPVDSASSGGRTFDVFGLDASNSSHTQVYLAFATNGTAPAYLSNNTMTLPSANETSADWNATASATSILNRDIVVPVTVRIPVFTESSDLVAYCATYDADPVRQTELTAQPCRPAHSGQLFAFSPTSNVIKPLIVNATTGDARAMDVSMGNENETIVLVFKSDGFMPAAADGPSAPSSNRTAAAKPSASPSANISASASATPSPSAAPTPSSSAALTTTSAPADPAATPASTPTTEGDGGDDNSGSRASIATTPPADWQRDHDKALRESEGEAANDNDNEANPYAAVAAASEPGKYDRRSASSAYIASRGMSGMGSRSELGAPSTAKKAGGLFVGVQSENLRKASQLAPVPASNFH